MSTDTATTAQGGVAQEGGVVLPPAPLSHRSGSIDAPPQPPSRTRYYDMSPQVPHRRKAHSPGRSGSRGPGRRGSRRSGSSSRRSDASNSAGVESSSRKSVDSGSSRRSRSSSRHRRSSSRSRRSSSGHRRMRSGRRELLTRSTSENKPGAYSYYDDMNDYAEALKLKEARSGSSGRSPGRSNGTTSPRRSDGNRRSPPSDVHRRSPPSDVHRRSPQSAGSRRSPPSDASRSSKHQDELKIYDEAFGQFKSTSIQIPRATKDGLLSDHAVGDYLEEPMTPTSMMTETEVDSDSEVVLPGAYASSYDADDVRLSRLHGRSKSRRTSHMRISMGGIDPLNLSNRDDPSTTSSATDRSSLEARKESRRSAMTRAASERSRRSSNRQLPMRDESSGASISFASWSNSMAVATAIHPTVNENASEQSAGEEEIREEVVDDEDVDVEDRSTSPHQTDCSGSTATDDMSESNVVAEIVKPKFRRSKKLTKRQSERQNRKLRQRCVYSSFFAAFLLIVGGGAIFLLLRFFATADDLSPTTAISNGTDDSTNTPSTSPTADVFTLQPTGSTVYDSPSPEDCTAIQNNEVVAGQSEMIFRNFNLHFDVTLDDQVSVDIDTWLAELLTAIETRFVPTLAGCDHALSSQEPIVNQDSGRRLAFLRYAVANADIDGEAMVEESCTTTPETPCFRVVVNLKVYLKGNVRIAQLLNLIVGLIEVDGFKGVSLGSVRRLRATPVLVDLWSLSPVFKVVTLAQIESANEASASPSIFPSISPSATPPSGSPSASPSQSDTPGNGNGKDNTRPPVPATPKGPPVVASPAPSTVAPSQTPSVVLSPSPTIEESKTPSVTPTQRPTGSPVVGPTLEPSEAPSEFPTSKPSFSPSAARSLTPSLSHSQTPSAPPSQAPSSYPSQVPSPVPSDRPSSKPSTLPSESPTIAPSPVPSSAPSAAPTWSAVTVDFDELRSSGGLDCFDRPLIVGNYENLLWDNFGVVDPTCIRCSGPNCSNAVFFNDRGRHASIRRSGGGTFDMLSMWVHDHLARITLTGFDEGRASAIHRETFFDGTGSEIGFGWWQLDLTAFKKIGILEIEMELGSNEIAGGASSTVFDSIELRFN